MTGDPICQSNSSHSKGKFWSKSTDLSAGFVVHRSFVVRIEEAEHRWLRETLHYFGNPRDWLYKSTKRHTAGLRLSPWFDGHNASSACSALCCPGFPVPPAEVGRRQLQTPNDRSIDNKATSTYDLKTFREDAVVHLKKDCCRFKAYRSTDSNGENMLPKSMTV